MTPVQPAQLSRRMIIGLSLAAPTLAVPWLAGCSSDDPAAGNPVRAAETPAAPTSSPAATSTPSPSPTAAASSPPPAAAAPEQALAGLTAAVLGGPHRQQLSKDRRALLTFLRNAHSAHARAIANPLPTQAPVKLGGQSLNASLALLARRETRRRWPATAGQRYGPRGRRLCCGARLRSPPEASLRRLTPVIHQPRMEFVRGSQSRSCLRWQPSRSWFASCTPWFTAISWRSGR